MPRGLIAELNSEVDGAVFRRLRRSRTKGVGHREDGDEADAVKRTEDSDASGTAHARGLGASAIVERRLKPALGLGGGRFIEWRAIGQWHGVYLYHPDRREGRNPDRRPWQSGGDYGQ